MKFDPDVIKSNLLASGHRMALDYIKHLESDIDSLKGKTRDGVLVGDGDKVYRANVLKLHGIILADEKTIDIESSDVRVVCGIHGEDSIFDWCSTTEKAKEFAEQDLAEILEEEQKESSGQQVWED